MQVQSDVQEFVFVSVSVPTSKQVSSLDVVCSSVVISLSVVV